MVNDISFEIKKNGVLGLLGSNGAGKSTTINILCGVLNQSEGEALIDGLDIRKNQLETKKSIGFLPQKAPLYMDLTVNEYLNYRGNFRLIPKKGSRIVHIIFLILFIQVISFLPSKNRF